MESVKKIGGMPVNVQADMGTENGTVEIIQTAVVGENSFHYGWSTTNQRIESWWSFFADSAHSIGMNIFEDLKDVGHFTGDYLDKNLIRFCFTNIVQIRYNCWC